MDENKHISKWIANSRHDTLKLLASGQEVRYTDTWKDLARNIFFSSFQSWNELYSSNRKKPIDAFLEEAGKRGYAVSTEELFPTKKDLWSYELSKGGYVFFYYFDGHKRYIKPEGPGIGYCCTLDANKLFDYLDETCRVLAEGKKAWETFVFETQQKLSVDRISAPLIEERIRERLDKFEVKHLVKEEGGELKLFFNIVKEVWIAGPINMSNMEDIIPFIPYVIKCPYDKKILGPKYDVVHDINGRLEAEWQRKNPSDRT